MKNFFMIIGGVLALALIAIVTIFLFCLTKAMALGWSLFLLVVSVLTALFFLVAIPTYEYFHK